MKRIVIAAVALLAGAAGLVLAAGAMGQARPDGEAASPDGRMGPPREAINACRKAEAGQTCRFDANGRTLPGQCDAPPGRPLACRPEGAALPGPVYARGESVPGSSTDTSEVACTLRHEAKNPALGLDSRYAWSCADGVRSLTGNGVPDHATGKFPNPGNPNRISAQHVSFTATLLPGRRDDAGMPVKISGYALNGVKFDPATAESCTDGCGNRGRGGGGSWRIEALGQNFFEFGVDANNAHVQPNGAYHYHGVPAALLSGNGEARVMTLVGWAVDGYPIYGPYGHGKPRDAASGLRPMRSSYRLKAEPDAGRPDTAMAPMGTFTQDYEYVPGLGDLDECNGRTDVTPEFPQGTYHYYTTVSFPYVQRCVKGDVLPGGVRDEGAPPMRGRR